MVEVDIAPQFGAELKDGFKPVNSWVLGGIAWLDDIQQFYRDRSALEKEYSTKLSALAKKYYEKKSKKSISLSVGDTPSLTPGSLESASLTTWTTQLSTVEARAAEHDRFATDLVSQLADPLKNLGIQFEEMRKRHAEYAAKLEQERDTSYAELGKVKSKYDGSCQELESRRKKAQSAFDHSKPKAQSAYHQQTLDMHNLKNSYLISINVTNRQKAQYYHNYVPELLDSLQDLSETKTFKLNAIWSLAAKIESSVLLRSNDHVTHLSNEVLRNDPKLDSMMFVRHNGLQWQEPPDKHFEPSPVWHDDDTMVVDDTAKIFLRNILGKSKSALSELKREVDAKRREVDNMRKLREKIRKGQEKKDEVEVVRAILHLQEQLHEVERKMSTAEVEKSTITSVVGDVSIGGRNHGFKAQTFKIPTNCDLCGDRIWGLSAKGFDCKDCGYTCHSKCELKVPADCPGEQNKEEKKKLKAERQEAANAHHVVSPSDGVSDLPDISRTNTMNSLSSGYAASAHRSVSGTPVEEAIPERTTSTSVIKSKPTAIRKNRIVAPPPTQYVNDAPANGDDGVKSSGSVQHGKALYGYQAVGDGEISIDDGQDVVIVEADEGGWTKIRAGRDEGLVPTSYLELMPAAPITTERPSSTYSSSSSMTGSTTMAVKKKGPAVAPKRGAKKLKYIEALYDYEARSEAEWSMTEGERFVLINKEAGDGWADVEKGGVTKSVPANYIQEVS